MDAVCKQFTDFYYTTFDTNRSGLAPLYREASMLSWEGKPFQGVTAITEQLANLPFTKVTHKVTTFDAQPSSPGNLIVLVTGLLIVDDSTNPLQFTQLFQLIAEGSSYYIYNDIFRLIYG